MIRNVVFPMAGMGTRLLPATKEVAKEILPVIDTPLIHLSVQEAADSGLERMIFITSRGKEVLENYFAPNPELERFLEEKGKANFLDGLRPLIDRQYIFLRQNRILGFGHAVLQAEPVTGNEPFALMLPDDLILSDVPAMKQMLDVYERYRLPMIAFIRVPHEEAGRYGIASGKFIEENLFEIESLVEKPKPGEARSNFAVMGRYILPPEIFRHLHEAERGAGAEIQLTDAIRALMKTTKVLGFFFEGERLDVGTPMGYVETVLKTALRREDTRAGTLRLIRDLAGDETL